MASGARPSSNQRSSADGAESESGTLLTLQKSRKSESIPVVDDRLSPPSTGLINVSWTLLNHSLTLGDLCSVLFVVIELALTTTTE